VQAAAPLVIADGLHADAAAFRKFSSRHTCHLGKSTD
jgi:hypothetical protein